MLHYIIGMSMRTTFSYIPLCVMRPFEIADVLPNLKRQPIGGSSIMQSSSQHKNALCIHRGRPTVLLALCRST